MPVARLKQFLDDQGVRYVVMKHSPAFTAQEVAAYTHIPGRELAKTVMVKIDGRMAMAVVPASHRVDFDRFAAAAGAERVELAAEPEFKDRFPSCDVGSMPPFGNLYDLEVYVAEALAEDVEIAFSAGRHDEIVRMAYADFERLVQPTTARFSTRA